MLKKLLLAIRHPGSILYPNSWCNSRFLEYLKENGVLIGKNTRFISPKKCSVDIGRGDYISIGDDCCLVETTLIAHDYSWYTFLGAYDDILPDPGGGIRIGDNCFLGYQTVVLKDTTIGNNVIIGARSIVKGNIPSNTVWAGCPAKQLFTLEEYYERKMKTRIQDAIKRRDHIKKKYGRNPTIEEMGLFAVLFLKRNIENYEKYIQDIEFNGEKNNTKLRSFFFNSTPCFESFCKFLDL